MTCLGSDVGRGAAEGIIRRSSTLRRKIGATLVLAQLVMHNSIANMAANGAQLQAEERVDSDSRCNFRGAVTALGVTNVEGRGSEVTH